MRGVVFREAATLFYPHFCQMCKEIQQFFTVPGLRPRRGGREGGGNDFPCAVLCSVRPRRCSIATSVKYARKYNKLSQFPDFARAGADVKLEEMIFRARCCVP